ncbi:hypothetical protein DFH27DRAFT_608951 [Peziza echinospora]|nr:hypothetical protein DFH27DRAFT_608951 [Peziza echinospora]
MTSVGPPVPRSQFVGPPLPKTYTAILVHNPGPNNTLTHTSLPLNPPKANEILIRNTFAGVNYIDTYFRSGLYPLTSPILGTEAEGVIAALGSDISSSKDPSYNTLQVGDRVAYFGSNAYAEYTAVDAVNVSKLPEWIPEGHGAAAIVQGLTALTLIREAYHVKKGDWILVHAAAGGVGLWLVQLLRDVGAHVIATASTDAKLELAKKNGAEHVINYTKNPDWVSAVKAITSEGVEAVFDGNGKTTFQGSLDVLKRKGTLATFGNASGPIDPVPLQVLTGKNLKLVRPRLFAYVATRQEFVEYADELWRIIKKGDVKIYIHKIYSWRDIEEAHRDIQGRGTTGKLLLKIDKKDILD